MYCFKISLRIKKVGNTFESCFNFRDREFLPAITAIMSLSLYRDISCESECALALRQETNVNQLGVIFFVLRPVPIIEPELKLFLLCKSVIHAILTA